jgi:hypothetical protein
MANAIEEVPTTQWLFRPIGTVHWEKNPPRSVILYGEPPAPPKKMKKDSYFFEIFILRNIPDNRFVIQDLGSHDYGKTLHITINFALSAEDAGRQLVKDLSEVCTIIRTRPTAIQELDLACNMIKVNYGVCVFNTDIQYRWSRARHVLELDPINFDYTTIQLPIVGVTSTPCPPDLMF